MSHERTRQPRNKTKTTLYHQDSENEAISHFIHLDKIVQDQRKDVTWNIHDTKILMDNAVADTFTQHAGQRQRRGKIEVYVLTT